MKKVFVLLLTISLLQSCTKDNAAQLGNNGENAELVSVVKLTDGQLISAATKILNLNQNNLDKTSMDIENALIYTYKNTEIKGISIPVIGLQNNVVGDYIFFLKDNVINSSNCFLLQKEYTDEKNFKIKAYDVDHSLISGVSSVNGIIETIKSNRLETRGCFTKCASRFMSRFTDGSNSGTAMGLLCIFAGPECAISLTLTCAGGCM